MGKEGTTYEKGKPKLPKITRSIIIPDDAKCEVKIIESEYVEYQMSIAPSKGIPYRDVNPADVPYEFSDIYEKDEFYPSITSELGTPYILRDFRGITVIVYPFTYNPKTQTLRVYHHIKLEINNVGKDDVNVKERINESYNINFADIYENHFINFNTNRYTSVSEYGRMIVICYGSFINEIQPYVDWKRQKGIDTDLYNSSDIGTTSTEIKDFIQYEYDLGDGLTFVQLVGDVAQIPTYYVETSYGADPVYSLLDGGDDYPDIFVGRFSGTTDAHIETQVERTIHYERDISSGGWLHWGLGVASDEGPGDDDELDYEHLDFIRTDLLGYNYDYVGQVYDPGATDTDVTNQFNWGRSFVNYTGHGSTTSWSTSGFNTTDINNLTNSFELPFICDVACLNGNFTGATTCFAETFLRATHVTTGDPIGAIAIYASSRNQPWSPPMDAQDEVTDLLVANQKRTIGGLFFNGSCHMMDEYSGQGDTFKSWNIFGDASLMIRTDTPTLIAAAHNPNIIVGATSFFVSTEPFAQVCLSDEDSNIISSGYTNFLGQIILSFPALTEGELTLTITSYNKTTYIAAIPVTEPGIWKGLASTEWNNAANWSASWIPDATTNVTIPSGTTYSPIISVGTGTANCKDLTIESGATLDIQDQNLVVNEDVTIHGELEMSNTASRLYVGNSIFWESGSTASMTGSAVIYLENIWEFKAGANVQLNSGYVDFHGSGISYIRSKDADCYFNHIRNNKSGTYLGNSGQSNQPLNIHGNLYMYGGCELRSYTDNSIVLNGFLNNMGGSIRLDSGTFKFNGNPSTVALKPNTDDYFNNLIINASSTLSLDNTYSSLLTVNGNMLIQSGALNANAFTTEVGGDWTNTVGTAGFTEGTGRVVFNSSNHQYCYGETFNILELNRPDMDFIIPNGTTTTCQQLDWTDYNGELEVDGGTFIAYDLEENGLFGKYYLTSSGGLLELHQDGGQYVDLNGRIVISNGTMNIYGGSVESLWPWAADATVTMSGGVLDFKDQGIYIYDSASYSFTETITGGTIRTAYSFTGNRTDFNPVGGTIDLYGTTDASISHAAGSNFYDVLINKAVSDEITRESKDEKRISYNRDGSVVELTRAETVNTSSDLDINGNLVINTGTLYSGDNTISINGNTTVNGSGVLSMQANSILELDDTSSLNVNSAGYLYVVGSAGNYATVTHQTTGFYGFNINSGGTIGAQYAIFEYMNGNGIYVKPGANVHSTFTFNHCNFRNGHDAPSALLALNDSSVFTSTGTSFYNNASGLTGYNVWKYTDSGDATFNDATGDFWGETYEYDTYNRVHWGVLQAIDDLTIQYNAGTNEIELNWTYPISVDQFKIYRSTDPYDFSGATIFTTATVGYSEPATSTKYFYQVTADNTTDNVISRKKGILGKTGISEEAGR